MKGLLVAALLLLGAFAIFGGWTGNYKAAMAAIKGKPATPAPPADVNGNPPGWSVPDYSGGLPPGI